MIFVIDDDRIMADCMASALSGENVMIFNDAIMAMDKIASGGMPRLIFLDILLDGPDGFTFLHEMASYNDTMNVPIVVVSSLDLKHLDLSSYNIVGVLNKDTMRPEHLRGYVERYCK